MNRLEGKVAVVTGANSGVGAAIAKLFAAEGATVVMTARREAALEEVSAQIEEAGYIPVAHFVLPESDWTSHYYHYYEANEAAFLERHSHSEDAKALVEENRQEMKHFEKYSAYYNYVFYIMQKR